MAATPTALDAFRDSLPTRRGPSIRLRPEDFHRYWWESNPDAASVLWISTLVCSGRKRHAPKALADVAAILKLDGSIDFEAHLPADKHGRRWVHMAGITLDGATRFFCPACALDLRIEEGRFLEFLRQLADTAPKAIDVSLLA